MKRILFALIVFSLFTGCMKNTDENECTYSECGFVAPSTEIQAVQNYLSTNSITATQHCSGLFYTVTQPGTGTQANFCSTVLVNYVGKLTNGNTFDQGNNSSFNLSAVIAGFRNGIPLIKAGGKITLYVPPSLGYGSRQDIPTIPPNSILIFTVDLLGVQ